MRWAKKGDETHDGDTDHVTTDRDSKLVVKHTVMLASTHDSTEVAGLVDD